jgi:hypothetical protein
MNTMMWGDSPNQHRAMGREGYGNGSDHIFEKDAFLSELVDIRRGLTRIAVATEAIGSAGIDAYEKNILDFV